MLPSVVILCGGRGTRLQGHQPSIPKPLVEIGGRPIVWHVIQIYIAHGFTDFVLVTGYEGERIERFVSGETWPRTVSVQCHPTGLDTPTGGRVLRAGRAMKCERFCVTYADGVADVDLSSLLEAHDRSGAKVTMTVVRPQLQFGVAELDGDDVVRGFVEKPRSEHWINGGFFCFERSALETLSEGSVLEREPLAALAAAGELRAFRHAGFWQCLDTLKDAILLNDLWEGGSPPWKMWN